MQTISKGYTIDALKALRTGPTRAYDRRLQVPLRGTVGCNSYTAIVCEKAISCVELSLLRLPPGGESERDQNTLVP